MDEATSTEPSLDEGPLWKYVTKLEKPPDSTSKSSGNTQFKCNYCDGVFVGSYSRVKAHLLKISGKGIRACKNVTPGHRLEMQKVHDQVENDKLEQDVEVEFLYPHFSMGLFPHSGNRMGVVVQMQWLMVRGGK